MYFTYLVPSHLPICTGGYQNGPNILFFEFPQEIRKTYLSIFTIYPDDPPL